MADGTIDKTIDTTIDTTIDIPTREGRVVMIHTKCGPGYCHYPNWPDRSLYHVYVQPVVHNKDGFLVVNDLKENELLGVRYPETSVEDAHAAIRALPKLPKYQRREENRRSKTKTKTKGA